MGDAKRYARELDLIFQDMDEKALLQVQGKAKTR
jgi:hypothetical protein